MLGKMGRGETEDSLRIGAGVNSVDGDETTRCSAFKKPDRGRDGEEESFV